MARRDWSRTLPVFVGLLVVLLLGVACAKSEKAAAPAPAAAPTAAPAAPAARPAPAAPAPAPAAPTAPSTAPATTASAAPVDGQPLVPGGPAFYPSRVSKLQGYQFLQEYHISKLQLWTKAKYGGESLGYTSWQPRLYTNTLEVLRLSRPSHHGMLLYTDSGRCSMVGREDFSACNGKYSHNQAIVIVSGIFTKWAQPDPLTYVFSMRKGVLWPSIPPMNRTDREVTSEDIAWFLTLTKDKGVLKTNFALVKEFQAVDRYTVKVLMAEPQADLLVNMAHTSMGIFPKECYQEKDCLDNKLISPGPFILKESTPRQRAVFERNPEFYLRGLPYWDRMVLLEAPDTQVQLAGYTTAKFDYFTTNSYSQMKGILGRMPGAQTHASGGIGGVSTMFQFRHDGPLADVRVRRALAMTMDHPTMWQAGVEGFSLFPTVISRDYYGAEFFMSLEQAGPWYQFNPQKAKQLLTEAGYANGFKTQMVFWSTYGLWQEYMLFLQSQWKKHLGVDVQIKTVDFVTYQSVFYDGTWEGMLNSGACWIRSCWGTADDTFANFITGGIQNKAKISDPKIDELYRKQRGELDPAKRRPLLWEFDQYELDNVYLLRVGVATAWIMMAPWEMNGASHETMWFTSLNGPTWMGMHDTSKYPGGRK